MLSEFFQDADGRGSMARLIVILTFPFTTWIVMDDYSKFDTYIGAYVLQYALGKGIDAYKGVKNATLGNSELASTERVDSSVTAVTVRESSTGKSKPARRGKPRAF